MFLNRENIIFSIYNCLEIFILFWLRAINTFVILGKLPRTLNLLEFYCRRERTGQERKEEKSQTYSRRGVRDFGNQLEISHHKRKSAFIVPSVSLNSCSPHMLRNQFAKDALSGQSLRVIFLVYKPYFQIQDNSMSLDKN